MFFLDKKPDDPYFNLAMEEYVLRKFDHDVFMLWQNNDSLVIGKHQNPLIEISHQCLLNKDLPVIRRISGGGTVFHGKGNINFTFICSSTSGEDKVNFPKYLAPIIGYLKTIGLEAVNTGKNSLSVSGLKISGNAAHVFKHRSIHHGTLLFDANLEKLNSCLAEHEIDYGSRAVASVRAKVTNINSQLKAKMPQHLFEAELKHFVLNHFGMDGELILSPKHLTEISSLAETKYRSNEWTYGYSPDYVLNRKIASPLIHAEVFMHIKKGRIDLVKITEADNDKMAMELAKALNGNWHIPVSIFGVIKSMPFANQLTKVETEQLTLQLF